jgi:hypothetical protein
VTVRRDAKPDSYMSVPAPHLQIVDDVLWQPPQHRLLIEAALPMPEPPGLKHALWNRRRPRHLLSQKMVCGVCVRPFQPTGKDYLGCQAAKNGGCCNTPHVAPRITRAPRDTAAPPRTDTAASP